MELQKREPIKVNDKNERNETEETARGKPWTGQEPRRMLRRIYRSDKRRWGAIKEKTCQRAENQECMFVIAVYPFFSKTCIF